MKQATFNLFCSIFETLKPPPDLTISTWADEFRRLSPESSAQPGRWSTEKAPYQKEIMDAISDISVEKVVVMSGAQIGKTDAFILNVIGYYMDNDPSPMLVMLPTLRLAESMSKDRLAPMLRDTPCLHDKVNDQSRNSGNTILRKVFPGGHITFVGANAPTDLSSRPIRILLADEIDRYPSNVGNEGDPLLLAAKRLTTFWNKREVCVSTPTVKGMSRIETEYEHSTQEEWHVPCPACETLTPLKWEYIVFQKDDLEEILMTCPHCGVVSDEIAWKQQGLLGKFVAENPECAVRGFHLNSLASSFTEWRDVVEKFLKANEEKKKGNIQLLKSWTNTEMGETWEEEGEQLKEKDLYRRREKYNCEVPTEVLYLTAGVDTQDDRFEVEVVGWGKDDESWGIQYSIIYGDLKQERVWNDLSNFLTNLFITADGRMIGIACTCMDSGGHFTTKVYEFCKKRQAQQVYAIKGEGGAEKPFLKPPSKNNVAKAFLFLVGVDAGKSNLYARLALEEEGAGYCHFPKEEHKGYNETYFEGLTAEKKVMTYKKGKAQFVWVLKKQGSRNEPLDIRNYATAAKEIVRYLGLTTHQSGETPKKKRGIRSKGVKA